MSTKAALGLAAVILLAGAAYYIWGSKNIDQPIVANGNTVVEWRITELPEQAGVPRTDIVMAIGDKTYPIGAYEGSCFEIGTSSWTLQPGEKTGVICWWGGGGNEVGIFEENGKLFVKQGELDEGDSETPGFRGNYKTLIAL